MSHSKNDSFGRKVFDELQLGTGFVSRQFEYHAGEATKEHKQNAKIKSSTTTQLVSQLILSNGTTLSYTYDAEERITSVTETYTVNGDTVSNTTAYTYDALGQLVTETVNGTVVNEMTYDNYGNILTKNGIEYTYDEVWKDKLISYNGQSINYDAQGNPINYLGHTLTWEKGRQLKSFDNIQYTYNANGIRTSKTIGGVRHDFVLDGAKILREGWNFDESINTYRDILVPLYDNEDSVCGIEYNGTAYYFLKNLQGDIIAIVDKDAQVVAKYSYDAWGVCTVTQDTSGCNIAHINPFRYRGYFFDVGTELYYLQSRYYDAKVGRFVNGDCAKLLGVNGDILGQNLFTYCTNDCVNKTDLNGNFVAQIVMALVGALIGAAGYLIGYFIEKNFFNKKAKFNWITFAVAVVVGAVDGVLSFAKLTKLVSLLVAFLMEFIPSFVGRDGIIEAFICAVLAAFISLFIGGTKMLNFGKSKYYSATLLKKLKSKNWDIIKKGVRTFFRKIFKHLKKFVKSSSINALFSIGNHTGVKTVKKLRAAL